MQGHVQHVLEWNGKAPSESILAFATDITGCTSLCLQGTGFMLQELAMLFCRYPACSMTDVAARELATVSISDYGEDDDVTYSSRFDPWIEQPQVEPTVIKQQS